MRMIHSVQPRRSAVRAGLIASLALAACQFCCAADRSSLKVGDQCTPIRYSFYKLGVALQGSVISGGVYTVTHISGNWVWLQDRGGWVNAADLVRLDLALDYFATQIKRNPRDVFALECRAWLYQSQNKTQLAIADCDRLVRLFPSNAQFYSLRAYLRSTAQPKEALADYSRALQLAPTELAFVERGMFLRRIGREVEALADFQRAISLYPDYQGGYIHFASLVAFSKDPTIRDLPLAVKQIEHAMKLSDRDHFAVLEVAAKIYLATGDCPRAIALQERAIKASQRHFHRELQETLDSMKMKCNQQGKGE